GFIARVGDGNDDYTGGAGPGDTYDLSLTTVGATVTAISAVSLQIGADTLNTIENIIGSQGDDSITLGAGANSVDGQGGNDSISAGAGNDTLNGGAGDDTLDGGDNNDTLNGGAGTDTLTGGAGIDTFVFMTPAEAGNGATRDRITDIQGAGVGGGDVIDVNGIDANTGVALDQAFTFIGTAAFTLPGQLRYVQVGGNTIVEG